MTLNDGFDRTVARWLDEQSGRGAPGYLDEVLARTSQTRQRPWWSSPERWLPMQLTVPTRLVPAPRIGWTLLVLALLATLIGAMFAIGSQRHLPAPFGLARNGLIVYGGTDGSIDALDPGSGATKALVAATSTDHSPWLSADGTKFLFLRDTTIADPAGGVEPMVMVADADGANVRQVTGPLAGLTTVDWAHDGTRIVVASLVDSRPAISIYPVGSSAGPLVVDTQGMTASFVQFRPGDRELTFRGSKDGADGLYAIGADGHGLRTILPAGQGMAAPALSPDGTRIAYQLWVTFGVIHVVTVDGGRDVIPAFDPPATGPLLDEGPTWSPDGTRLLFQRYQDATQTYQLAIAPAAGGPVIEIGPAMPTGTDGAGAQFSPDGTKVIAFYNADKSTWLLDPTGRAKPTKLPSTIADVATWQRLAP